MSATRIPCSITRCSDFNTQQRVFDEITVASAAL